MGHRRPARLVQAAPSQSAREESQRPLHRPARAGLGISVYAARRALRALEAAGLLSAVRRAGRCPEVTLLDAPTAPGLEKQSK